MALENTPNKICDKFLLLEIFCTSYFWGFTTYIIIILLINSRLYWELLQSINNVNANIEKLIYSIIWQITTIIMVMHIYRRVNITIFFTSLITAVLIFYSAFIMDSFALLLYITLIPITMLLSVFAGSYGLSCSIIRLLRVRVAQKTMKKYGWNIFIPVMLFLAWAVYWSTREFSGLLFINQCIFIISIFNALHLFQKIKAQPYFKADSIHIMPDSVVKGNGGRGAEVPAGESGD